MNKADLAKKVSEVAALSKIDASKAVDAVFEVIADALAQGEEVKIKGHGGYSVKERAARQGRNPQTNEPIEIAASKAAKFKPAKALTESVQ